jgi:AcrR family transcriptional regulator
MSSAEIEHSGPRERILKTAGKLFYEDGYRAVGIDKVIAEAQVAKASFYKYFPSKDDLIVAWIKQAEAGSLGRLPDMQSPTPLFDYMDMMIGIADQTWCMGCTFQGAASEFGEVTHPAHAAALQVKENTIAELKKRARAQGLSDPDKIAGMMFLLLEGIWASVRMFKSDAPIENAKTAVRLLADDTRLTPVFTKP